MANITNGLNKVWRFFSGPPLKEIERREKERNHFTKGLNFFKLFWIFFVGCFAGVVVEEIWCVANYHVLESRTALIFGPFNPVYGFGAVGMTLGLYALRYKSDFVILIGGSVIGGAIEYICSWVQEQIFGTVSWDYSDMPFNINGRICLLYCLFWGILSIIWMKMLYPRICSLILKIPNKTGKILSLCLTFFMIFNMLFSAAAVNRWSTRVKGTPAATSFERFLDRNFDNNLMSVIYPNMIFIENGNTAVRSPH